MPQKFAEELCWSSRHSSGAVEISGSEGLFSLRTCVYPRTISNVLLLLLWSWFLRLLHTTVWTTFCAGQSALISLRGEIPTQSFLGVPLSEVKQWVVPELIEHLWGEPWEHRGPQVTLFLVGWQMSARGVASLRFSALPACPLVYVGFFLGVRGQKL